MGYFSKVFGGGKSLVTGMGITLRELFGTTVQNKAVTLQYPKEKPVLSPAYRSAIKLIRFEESNSHDCVACKACERICPSFCIKLDGGKVEGIKKKRVATFEMDFALCSLCGLCLDVCPTDTLEYSKVYDEAGYNRDWRVDLVAEFRDYEEEFVRKQRAIEEKAAEEKKAKAEAAKAAKAKAAEAKAAKAKAEDAKAGDEKNETKAETKADGAKTDGKTETKADGAKTDGKTETKADGATDGKTETQAETQADATGSPQAKQEGAKGQVADKAPGDGA